MDCYVCRQAAHAHVIRRLRASQGPGGWARVCVPCAIKHDLDGQLLAGPNDGELARQWLEHQARKRASH